MSRCQWKRVIRGRRVLCTVIFEELWNLFVDLISQVMDNDEGHGENGT